VQDLARRYSTSYSADYVKTYLCDNKIENDELDVKDFHAMGTGQFESNKKNIHSPETRKVFFADTDVMMTKTHMKMYADGEEFNQLKTVFDYFIQLQNWSLILVLPPTGNQDVHTSYNQKMHEMILHEIADQQLNDLTHILDGESYREQYQEAHTLVDEILKTGKDN